LANIVLHVPIDDKKMLLKAAEAAGMSVGELILEMLAERELDNRIR
jgi:uncharacterized protein (DUF1778 family)